MSARDSESGSSTYKGGSGRAGGLGNGGIGGGMGGGGNYGGGGGGGAGRSGGIGSKTGLTTGKDWYGNTAFGRSGGRVAAYGTRDAQSLARAGMAPTVGSFGNFRTPTGQAMFAGSPVQGQSFYGRNMGQALSQAQRAQAAWQQAQSPASVPGLLADPVPAAVMEAIPAYTPNPFYQGMPPPAQYSSIYKNRIAELLNAQRPPPPAAIQGPAWTGPTGYWQKNPTSYPQWSTGWKNQTDNYYENNTYPGFNYTTPGGRNHTWSNEDNRFGIDKMARDRGF